MENNFSVMDMVSEFADENNIDVKSIFDTPEEKVEEKPKEEVKKERDWNPDESLLDDLPELNKGAGAVYDKDEIKVKTYDGLKNIADEEAKNNAIETMDELQRKEFNIEEAKKRRGIKKLQIPPGPIQTRFLIAASDTDYKKSQSLLDALFDEIEETYPFFILERENDVTSKSEEVKSDNNVSDNIEESKIVEVNEEEIKSDEESVNTKIIIDKTNVNTIAWSKEEIEKIKKSRSIELNIVEEVELKISEVQDIDDNAIDTVLSSYVRKSNDVVGVLPASKYRATFSGLTYPEVLDLSTSQELNNLDAEWKKWSICFNHLKNPSIGEFEEYYIYKENNKEVRVKNVNDIPEGKEYHIVTKFEDFLRKTSYLDLGFMLWKILCATTREQEIVSIDCEANISGNRCGHTYDWVYSPEALLDESSIPDYIMKEIEETATTNSFEESLRIFKTSPVNTSSSIKLQDSGFIINVGHISAYRYLDEIYSFIKSLDEIDGNDPTILSKGMAYSTLTSIKNILIPQGDDKYVRVSTPESIVKVLTQLNEFDWQSIAELTKMVIDPYVFRYVMKDLVCPKCKNKSKIEIEDMSSLLFIIALSLSSVQVKLKKN